MESTGWRKSSYSGSNTGNCVELGQVPGAVLVRDTTDRGGFTMTVAPAAWRSFTSSLKTGSRPR
jgi:hypothetical protein